jgi:hypothetical protein
MIRKALAMFLKRNFTFPLNGEIETPHTPNSAPKKAFRTTAKTITPIM